MHKHNVVAKYILFCSFFFKKKFMHAITTVFSLKRYLSKVKYIYIFVLKTIEGYNDFFFTVNVILFCLSLLSKYTKRQKQTTFFFLQYLYRKTKQNKKKTNLYF